MDLNPTNLTGFHTLLSLVALGIGAALSLSMASGRDHPSWAAAFLAAATATSVTGFLFPYHGFLPSHGVGAVALLVLAPTLLGRYVYGLDRYWRAIYVAGFVASTYFIAFVAVAQAFQKTPALRALAPTQSEPPFLVAQAVLLAAFVWLGLKAVRASRRMPATPAAA